MSSRTPSLLLLCSLLMASSHTLAQTFPDPEDLPAQPTPPDPLVMRDGTPVKTAEQWPARRAEIQQLFENYVYGSSPAIPPTSELRFETLFEKEFYDGKGILREVVIHFPPQGTPPMYLLVAIPKSEQPVPAFVGLNFAANHSTTFDTDVKLSEVWLPKRYKGVVDNHATEEARGVSEERWPYEMAIDRGYAMATVYHGDLDPDFADFSNGVHPFFYAEGQTEPKPEEWGAIGAWAWGLSIAGSYLMQDPAINPDQVCVMGHSRNGKTSLWAGAQDERFALVVSNMSGCGGAAMSRRREGEKLENINGNFPHWFNDRFPQFNEREDHLPVDQHMLISMIAPRPVLVNSAVEDTWADPPGEFESCKLASPVFELLGQKGLESDEFPDLNHLVNGRVAYHIRPGKHNVTEDDWKVFFDFADEQLQAE